MMACVSRRCPGGAVLLAWALIWGQPWVRADSREALTIVAFGDSTTAPREVEGNPLTVYADILRKELPSKGMKVDVVNAGTRGDTTADATKRLTTDVLSHEPDVVIVQFGANDAMVDLWKSPPATQPRVAIGTYERNLRTIVRTLSDRGAKVILMTPNRFRWRFREETCTKRPSLESIRPMTWPRSKSRRRTCPIPFLSGTPTSCRWGSSSWPSATPSGWNEP